MRPSFRFPFAWFLPIYLLLGCSESRSSLNTVAFRDLDCDTCMISLREIVRVASDEQGALLDFGTMFRRGPGDATLAAPLSDRFAGVLYDRVGSLVGRFGRNGDGPGDYRSITAAVARSDDSVIVLEGALNLHGPDLTFVRRQGLDLNGMPRRIAPLKDNRLALDVSDGKSGFFTYVRRDLSVERTFGQTERVQRGYHLSGDGHGGIWAVPFGSHWAILHFDSLGQRIPAIMTPPSWYESLDESEPEVGDPRVERPGVRFAGIWADSLGRIWIAAVIADRNWRADPAGLPEPDAHGEVQSGIMLIDRWPEFFDGALAVYDVRSGQLLAERIVDNVISLSPEGVVGELIVTPDEEVAARVFTPTLKPR
ncbi:MAG TPA: hypothetical protein VF037_09495 [Gemmatimonadales bacterium]